MDSGCWTWFNSGGDVRTGGGGGGISKASSAPGISKSTPLNWASW